MTSGVYEIRCSANGRAYIGSAVNIKRRWARHRYDLRSSAHANPHLQRAWNKYGEEAFEFSVIEECDAGCLLDAEQRELDRIESGFNIRKKADSNVGLKTPEDVRLKISAAKKGMSTGPHTQATRDAMSKMRRGIRHSRKHVENQAKSRMKLSSEEAGLIRERVGSGESRAILSMEFNVSKSAIDRVMQGKGFYAATAA